MFGYLRRKSKKTEQAQKGSDCAGMETQDIRRAREVAEKYKQMQECCTILSKIVTEPGNTRSSYSHGWRIWEYNVTGSGIDVEEVYEFIGKLAIKRKAEIERDLAKISG